LQQGLRKQGLGKQGLGKQVMLHTRLRLIAMRVSMLKVRMGLIMFRSGQK
jgi:hypothetical protein